MAQKRECGVLLPVSSLPSKYGIGCFDKKAYEFVDALKEAGQSYWQILPLVDRPAMVIHRTSLSLHLQETHTSSVLKALIEEGVLTKKECDKVDFGTDADQRRLCEIIRRTYAASPQGI